LAGKEKKEFRKNTMVSPESLFRNLLHRMHQTPTSIADYAAASVHSL